VLERAYTHLRQGDTAAADADIAAARAASKTSTQLNNMCWFLATRNILLQQALSACSAALEKDPESVHALDSKGFVLLRLQRYGEAVAAYDAALARRAFPASLYGRGIAKRQLGWLQGAKADMQAAMAKDPDVAKEFADYGVK
jgi:tetratricopeptide (TPR) repeat protein